MESSKYLKYLSSTSLVLIVVTIVLNYFVNPFSIFDLERVSGVNEIKPNSSNRIGTFKKYQPIYFQPKTILVGNSRVEMGLDPEQSSLETFQPVYNLGVPGPATRGQLSYAQNVVDKSNVKIIILALDFRDFLDEQDRKNANIPHLEVNQFKDKLSAVISLDSLEASIITLFSQKEDAGNRLSNGFNPANEYREIIKAEGQSILFKHQLISLNSKLKGKNYDPNKIKREISILNGKITEWMSNGIEVKLFINPYHKDYYKTLDENKLLYSFNTWREEIKKTFFKRLNFCDFTFLGYQKSEIKITENELKYFWEPTHYKKELGDIMIPMILNGCT